MIKYAITASEKWNLVEFELENTLEPADLKTIELPDIKKFYNKGIILSGRGPIWLYGLLIHHFHPTPFVATFEPRLQAGVVVESHSKDYQIGDLIHI